MWFFRVTVDLFKFVNIVRPALCRTAFPDVIAMNYGKLVAVL